MALTFDTLLAAMRTARVESYRMTLQHPAPVVVGQAADPAEPARNALYQSG
jgi:hypothetical protein